MNMKKKKEKEEKKRKKDDKEEEEEEVSRHRGDVRQIQHAQTLWGLASCPPTALSVRH